MKKKYFKFMAILVLSSIFFQESGLIARAESDGINVEAKSALLMEPVSGKIIYEKNIHEKFAPASVTKIMTMLLTMERIDSGTIKLSDKVTVSENAKKMGGSSMILDTGEIRTVDELLKGIAVASGNDASVAMAEYIGGTESNFVKLMNEKACELGMKDTVFKNCTGLSATGHLSSAYDISLMSRELLKHKSILNYTSIYMETISEGRKTPIGLVNHNKLVRFFKGCDGLKTGFTEEAKYCISATAVRENVRMLSVIMGAPTYKIRNKDASMLMNYGFSKYESKTIFTKDMDVQKIMLNNQQDRYFVAKASKEFLLTLEKGKQNKIDKKITVNANEKHYKKGQIIGYCEIYLNNTICGRIPLYSDRDLKKLSIWENFKINVKDMFENAI